MKSEVRSQKSEFCARAQALSPWFRVGSVDGLALPVHGEAPVAGNALLTGSPARGNVHGGKGRGASRRAPHLAVSRSFQPQMNTDFHR